MLCACTFHHLYPSTTTTGCMYWEQKKRDTRDGTHMKERCVVARNVPRCWCYTHTHTHTCTPTLTPEAHIEQRTHTPRTHSIVHKRIYKRKSLPWDYCCRFGKILNWNWMSWPPPKSLSTVSPASRGRRWWTDVWVVWKPFYFGMIFPPWYFIIRSYPPLSILSHIHLSKSTTHF